MSRESPYQDLQFKDKNIYSVLDTPAASQQTSSQNTKTSKDVKELERQLLIWRRTSMTVSLLSLLVIIVGVVVFLTQCKKQENKGLQELLVNTCATNEQPCRYCANSWIYFSGNCYFFSSDVIDWTHSRDQCRSMGSTLAIIKNREEETFVEKTASGISWIGLSMNTSGVWIWEDGTVLKGGEGFWKPNEPNNQNGAEKCVDMATKVYNPVGWNDQDCLSTNRRICKRTAFTFST